MLTRRVEIWHIDERKDGAVFKTSKVSEDFLTMGEDIPISQKLAEDYIHVHSHDVKLYSDNECMVEAIKLFQHNKEAGYYVK